MVPRPEPQTASVPALLRAVVLSNGLPSTKILTYGLCLPINLQLWRLVALNTVCGGVGVSGEAKKKKETMRGVPITCRVIRSWEAAAMAEDKW